MNNKSLDRRVLRTKQSLYDALFELVKVKRYSKITIQDIIDRANVGRSTFYSHFETKDDLLFASTQEHMNHLNEYIKTLISSSNKSGILVSVQELFEHIYENEKSIRSIFIADGMDFFRKRAKRYWQATIQEYLDSYELGDSREAVPSDILSSHIAMTLINMLEFSLISKKKYTPSELDKYFQQLVNPILQVYLDNG